MGDAVIKASAGHVNLSEARITTVDDELNMLVENALVAVQRLKDAMREAGVSRTDRKAVLRQIVK